MNNAHYLFTQEKFLLHSLALREYLENIVDIKFYIKQEDYSRAYEAWHEVPNWAKAALWRATSKGGIFTPHERRIMKSDLFKL